MDVQSTDSNRSSDWASSTTSSEAPVSSSAEDFADFTDISKFGMYVCFFLRLLQVVTFFFISNANATSVTFSLKGCL